jgi:rare lipoprotein A
MHSPEHARKGCLNPVLGGFLSLSAFAAAFYGAINNSAEAVDAPSDNSGDYSSQECEIEPITHRNADLKLEGTYFFLGELDAYPPYQEGRAHFYGGGESLNEFTSSGDRFDPDAMAAASWFYPLGTQVLVTDLNDGDKIVVRINDRGPNRVDRPDVIIDLTAGAMHTLEPEADWLMVSVAPVCAVGQ